ncbi:hypothetical protein JVT61DRAFT_491 [Boletus reticuloceps]|uniref:Uncharacterized protein n=1 Tax=Boletus reticuloceps TaxID=495285 RepID=A0A8I3AGT3_9AGAM|nr:hypothetical protein JVT61DRAFT_491 [Boletus reticuloceps]
MRLPSTIEEALDEMERRVVWLSKRYPETLSWVNESYSSGIALFTWPQTMDELLDDMGLPNMRSVGNWITWPLKAFSVDEIATLREERHTKREADAQSSFPLAM